jgi:hypothetical protein
MPDSKHETICTVCATLTDKAVNVRVGGQGGTLQDLCPVCLGALRQVRQIDLVTHAWDERMNYVPTYAPLEGQP